MKRVLFTAGMLASAAIGVCACLPYKFALYVAVGIFAAILIITFAARKCEWKFSVIICLAIVLIMLARFYITTVQGPKASEILVGKTADVSGVVKAEPEYHNGKYIYYVTTDKVGHPAAPQNLSLKLFLDKKLFDAYDTFEAQIKFYELNKTFRFSSYAENIYLSAYPIEITKTGHAGNLFGETASDIRLSVRTTILKNLPEEVSGILVGLITDGTAFLDDETYIAFKTCGLSHTVTVSGMHMAIVSNSVMITLAFFGISKRHRFFFCLPLLVLYAAISGFTPAAIRSVVMISAVFFGDLIYRRNDRLNTLGATAIGMLLISPYLLFSISFLLSFSAMAGILLAVPFNKTVNSKITLKGAFGDFIRYITSLGSSTVAANLATFPIVALVWGGVSTVTVIANLVISFAMDAILIFGIILVAIAVVTGENFVVDFLFKLMESLLFYIRSSVMLVAGIPNSYITFDIPTVSALCAIVFSVVAIVMLIKEAEKEKMIRTVQFAAIFIITATLAANIF